MHPDVAFGNLDHRARGSAIAAVPIFIHIDEQRTISLRRQLAAEANPGEGARAVLRLVMVVDEHHMVIGDHARITFSAILDEDPAGVAIVSGAEGANETIETIGNIDAEDDAVGSQSNLGAGCLPVTDDKLVAIHHEVLGADEGIVDLGGTAVVNKGRTPIGRIVERAELAVAAAGCIAGNENLVSPPTLRVVGDRAGRRMMDHCVGLARGALNSAGEIPGTENKGALEFLRNRWIGRTGK